MKIKYLRNGQEVTREEFAAGSEGKLEEALEAQRPPDGTPTTGWPLASEALAVHPEQVAQANARAIKHGINVKYDADGICHVPDRGEHRKILKLEGLHCNNSFGRN